MNNQSTDGSFAGREDGRAGYAFFDIRKKKRGDTMKEGNRSSRQKLGKGTSEGENNGQEVQLVRVA